MFKTKIYAGIAIIVVLGVLAMLYIYRSLGDVAGYVATLNRVSVPFSIAALEMEKNTGEYANGVLRYIGDPDPAVRKEIGWDLGDFHERYAIYRRLSTNERERSLGRKVAHKYKQLTVAGEALMNQRDRLDGVFHQTTDLLEEVDRLADDRMAAAAPGSGSRRSARLAAIADLEAESAEIGFWLTLFRNRPSTIARQRLQQKVREQQSALAHYRSLPLRGAERKLAGEASSLHRQIADNVNKVIIGETDISQAARKLETMADDIDDIFDNEIQVMMLEGLSEPKANTDAAIEHVQDTLRYLIPIYFLVALVIGILLILAIIRPLKRLAVGTEAIGAGDLDHRIDVHGNDEFGKLASEFNQMTSQLKESTVSRSRLEASEQQLQRTVVKLRQEIAERQRSEREREKLRDKLQRTETLTAMGRLVAGVAHEVRNPLFGISSTLDAMDANTDVGPVNPRYREVLRREASRLNRLMATLLDYGRTPPSEHTVEPLGRVVAEAIEHCQATATAAGITLINEATGDAAVAMHHDRLLQVFVNVIENAIQHAPNGSDVVIATRAATDEAGQPWIECRVMDSGPGFAADDLPRVFDPFFTRRRKGTGLGLAIVQRIVDEHHGTIEPRNRDEGGAIVTVRLPVAPSDA